LSCPRSDCAGRRHLVAGLADDAFRIDGEPAAMIIVEDVVMVKIAVQKPELTLLTDKIGEQSDRTVHHRRGNRHVLGSAILAKLATPILDGGKALCGKFRAM
jgi:hypothetical protein